MEQKIKRYIGKHAASYAMTGLVCVVGGIEVVRYGVKKAKRKLCRN